VFYVICIYRAKTVKPVAFWVLIAQRILGRIWNYKYLHFLHRVRIARNADRCNS